MTIFQEWCGNLPPEEACQILLEYPLTDAGNGESFKTLFGERFCYVSQVGKWFKCDGVRSAEMLSLACWRRCGSRGRRSPCLFGRASKEE